MKIPKPMQVQATLVHSKTGVQIRAGIFRKLVHFLLELLGIVHSCRELKRHTTSNNR